MQFVFMCMDIAAHVDSYNLHLSKTCSALLI